MALTVLPRQKSGLGEFSEAMNPYMQMAMQAMLQRKLQEQQYQQGQKALTPSQQDIQQEAQRQYGTKLGKMPESIQGIAQKKAQRKVTKRGDVVPEKIRKTLGLFSNLPENVQASVDVAPGVSVSSKEPSLLSQLGVLKGTEADVTPPSKPTTKPVKGHEWALSNVKGEGGQIVGQQWAQEPIDVSLNVEKQRKNIAAARRLIKRLRDMRRKLGSTEGYMARVKGYGKKLKGIVGEAPEVSTYEDLRRAVFGQLARIVSGERGRLTNQDIERIQYAIPSALSTGEEVEQKFEALERILEESERIYGTGNQQGPSTGTTSSGMEYTIER